MAAYNINGRCESCTFADSYGRACKHGLLFPVLVMMSFDNGWEYVPYSYKAKDRACREFEYREDLIWMQNKIINK